MPEQSWVLCGKPEHWSIALKDEIWGLIPKFKGKWRYLRPADWLFFYATSPVTGVIGFGKVQSKFKQNKPLWSDELLRKEVLYPFRFEFQSEYVLPEEQWKARKIKLSLPIGFYSGMNLLDDQDIIDTLVEAARQQWGAHLGYEAEVETYKPQPSGEHIGRATPELSHDKIKDMIFEIGKIHHYITEKEYIINADRLDVVWRRVEKSVPTYAFEVQIGGDIYHALAKLKHAYDIWNSNIYIVTSEEHRNKIEELLTGTFHEIRNVLNIISLKHISDLYSLQLRSLTMSVRAYRIIEIKTKRP
jgi:predicted RNA-binding protein